MKVGFSGYLCSAKAVVCRYCLLQIYIRIIKELKLYIMKKNITSLLVCFAIVLTTLGATNPVVHNPIKKNFLIESNELNVSLVASSNQDMFINASYNNLTGTLNFKTVDEISFIQIFKFILCFLKTN